MKKLLKIILIGIVAAITYKYLNEKGINISQHLKKVVPLLENLFEKAETMLDEVRTTEDNTTGSTKHNEEAGKELKREPLAGDVYSRPSSQQPETSPVEKVRSNKKGDQYGATITRSVRRSPAPKKVVKQPEKKSPTPYPEDEKYGWIKAVTKRYAPNAWYLLMSYDQLPAFIEINNGNGSVISSNKPSETFFYLHGKTQLKQLGTMATNVHELAHARASHMALQQHNQQGLHYVFGSSNLCLFINEDEEYLISFPREKMFPARKLASVIPPRYHTFRYSTYIEGDNSTQTSGIFGLLDELNAYYIDSEFSMDIFPAFVEACESREEALIQWVRYSQSGMEAYYEFSFFIFEYLLYMKNHHPQSYHDLMAHDAFRMAFKRINNLYVDLVIRFLKKIEQEAELLSLNEEMEVRLDKDLLKFSEASGTRTLPVMDGARITLDAILKSNRYNSVKQDVRHGVS